MSTLSTRVVGLISVGAVAGCGGVLINQGNDFPCDFSKPADQRDAPCAKGEVCAVTNRCRPYVYEGPRFEGPPTLPDFSADAGGGTVLHPLVLRGTVTHLGRDPNPLGSIALEADGTPYLLRARGTVSPFPRLAAYPSAIPLSGALLAAGRTDLEVALGIRADDAVALSRVGAPGLMDVPIGDDSTGDVLRVQRLRAVSVANDRTKPLRVVGISKLDGSGDGGLAGQITFELDGGVLTGGPPSFAPFSLPADAGRALDIGWANRGTFDSPIIVTADALLLVRPDGGFENAVTEPMTTAKSAVLKSDKQHNVYALLLDKLGSDPRGTGILSTWTLSRPLSSWQLERAWPDCRPCADQEKPAVFAPVFRSSGVSVEVACASRAHAPRLVRVVGSVATDPLQACETETLDLPMDWRSVTRDLSAEGGDVVNDSFAQDGVTLGGVHGEVWSGDTLEHAQPAFLERVPLDVSTVPSKSGPVMLALTDRYLALQEPGNGFRRLLVSSDGPLRPMALVRGAPWGVAASGDLEVVLPPQDLDGGVETVGFGPRLLDGRDQPVQQPLVGEAIATYDGGLVSAVIAADDSLYLIPYGFSPSLSPGELGSVTPVLTPAPSSFIRSLALERTPIGTNGIDKVRGYLVASRTVFAFQLGGTPPRWTATPLVLSGAEPVEVWFDNPRGGLARVGYRDGEIFTLPGGYQLAEAFEATGGQAPQVLDYENLAGWPVAYTTAGLFVAAWDVKGDGSLDNKLKGSNITKPMTWREVKLPDGSRPWLDAAGRARPARLVVQAGPQLQQTVAGTYGMVIRQTFTLSMFLDDRVLVVGRHVRENSSTPVQ